MTDDAYKDRAPPILPLRDSEKPLNSFFCTRGLVGSWTRAKMHPIPVPATSGTHPRACRTSPE